MRKYNVLDRDNSLVLRGLAILSIMLHNLLHSKSIGYLKENEMSFKQGNADAFTQMLSDCNEVVPNLISYIGWIGVPVFIFLTGYGLAKNAPPRSLNYLKKKYIKLFCLMLPAVVFYVIKHAMELEWWEMGKKIISLTMLQNFDYPDLRYDPGVYWYFSLTFQLYIVYYFLWNELSSKALLIASIVSLAGIYLFATGDYPHFFSIYRHCVTGWFFIFALGIWAARNDEVISRLSDLGWKEELALCLAFFLLTLVSSLYYAFWAFTPIFALFAFVFLAKLNLRGRSTRLIFSYIGRYSACIFVCHPIARIFIRALSRWIENPNIYMVMLVYLVLTLMIAMTYNKLYLQLRKCIN